MEHCTQHYMNKQALIQIVLDDIRKYARMVLEDTEGLAFRLAALNSDKEE